MKDAMQWIKSIDEKLKTLNDKSDYMLKIIKNFYSLNIPSYVPDVTGRQIYKLCKLGWSLDQIKALSGYSEDEIQKKYMQYVKNNV